MKFRRASNEQRLEGVGSASGQWPAIKNSSKTLERLAGLCPRLLKAWLLVRDVTGHPRGHTPPYLPCPTGRSTAGSRTPASFSGNRFKCYPRPGVRLSRGPGSAQRWTELHRRDGQFGSSKKTELIPKIAPAWRRVTLKRFVVDKLQCDLVDLWVVLEGAARLKQLDRVLLKERLLHWSDRSGDLSRHRS